MLPFFFQGNITFEMDNDQVCVSSREELSQIACLLSMDVDNLETSLCSRVVAAGGDVVRKEFTLSDAIYTRDAFAKVRGKIFFFFSGEDLFK